MKPSDELAIARAAERIHAERRRAQAERERRGELDALAAELDVLPTRAYGARLQLLDRQEQVRRRR